MLSSGAHGVRPDVPASNANQRLPGHRGQRRDWYLVYCFVLLATISVLTLIEPDLMHWFLVPIIACGLIIGKDAVEWLTGRCDPFDPKGVIGILGVHLFVIAPLAIALWDYDYDVAPSPQDWRPWLGIMAGLNAVGLLLYNGVARLVFRYLRFRPRRWLVDENRALIILFPALIITGLAQAYLWMRFGGLTGQIRGLRTEALIYASGQFKYTLLGGAFPLILLITLTVLRSRHDREKTNYSVAFIVLLLVLGLFFIASGLRGSRAATVWTLFWAVGILHYFWRRLDARIILAGLIPVFLFMYLYGLYKAYGYQVFERYQESSGVAQLSERSGRTVKRLVVADLSRADIQAFMVYRLVTAGSRYQLEWGATYAEAVPRVFLPSWIWAGRPRFARKSYAGMKLHFGGPSPYGDRFSKVFGLAGEAMLNFHFVGVLFAFAVLGALMGAYRRHFLSWQEYDARLFIAPFVANWFLSTLVSDFNNLLSFALTKAAVPAFLLILICNRKTRR